MTVREWDFEPVRGRVRKPMYAVCQEIVILPLFAVRDDRRSSGFKPFDGVSNGLFVERGKGGVFAIAFGEFLDESRRPRNAADRLRGYGDQGRPSIGHARTSHPAGRSEAETCADRLWTFGDALRPSRPACWVFGSYRPSLAGSSRF